LTRLIGLLLLIATVAFMLSPRLRAWLRARAPMMMLIGIAGVFLVLAVSGRLNWIFAAIAAALPLAWRVISLLQLLPWLRRLLGGVAATGSQGSAGADTGGAGRQAPGRAAMSREEALEILGLDPEAGREEIQAAHRRLIQRLHPDRGGSGYLASRLNEARDRLLRDDAAGSA